MRQIIIVCSGGEVKIETSGFTGKSCEEATAALEKVLGTVTDNTKTAEWYQAAPTKVRVSR